MTAEVINLMFDAGRIIGKADTNEVSDALWAMEALRDIAERLTLLGCPEARAKVLTERNALEDMIVDAWEDMENECSDKPKGPA